MSNCAPRSTTTALIKFRQSLLLSETPIYRDRRSHHHRRRHTDWYTEPLPVDMTPHQPLSFCLYTPRLMLVLSRSGYSRSSSYQAWQIGLGLLEMPHTVAIRVPPSVLWPLSTPQYIGVSPGGKFWRYRCRLLPTCSNFRKSKPPTIQLRSSHFQKPPSLPPFSPSVTNRIRSSFRAYDNKTKRWLNVTEKDIIALLATGIISTLTVQ